MTTAVGPVPQTTVIHQIAVTQLQPHPANRKQFDPKKLEELAASIAKSGVHTPLIVRPAQIEEGSQARFEILAGERRWRAAQKVLVALPGHNVTVPCVIRHLTDDEALELLLTENLQREDPHPLEEADAYAAWLERPGHDVKELAARIGKSIAHVYSRLQLRTLTDGVKELLWAGKLPVTHAQLMARASAKQQEKAVAELKRRLEYSDNAGSLVDLTEDLVSYERELAQAPFPTTDATLCPAAGACATCPKRSGYKDGMFPELQEALVQLEIRNGDGEEGKKKLPPDTCLDESCWDEKMQANAVRQLEAARAKHGDKVVELSLRRGDAWPAKETAPLPLGVWTKATKSTKGAVPGVVVVGEANHYVGPDYHLGALLWVTLKPKPRAGASKAEPKKPAEQSWERERRLRDERAKVEHPRRLALAKAILAAPAPKLERATLVENILGRIHVYGLRQAAKAVGFTVPKLDAKIGDRDLVGVLLLESFADELGEWQCGDKAAPAQLLEAAKFVGLDAKKVLADFDAKAKAAATPAPAKAEPKKRAGDVARAKKAKKKGGR